MIVDQKIRLAVHVGHGEGEDDVDSKEGIDNVVHNEHGVLLVGKECKLERGDPRGVDDQENQKHLPCPETRNQEYQENKKSRVVKYEGLITYLYRGLKGEMMCFLSLVV